MITNSGKQIIGKYLLQQAPAFATHIVAGCGIDAFTPTYELTDAETVEFKAKQTLEFEMFRVPIIARGFIKENGVEKIVIKAEMPTDQRYQITEVGFFSDASNSLAGTYDSKGLYTFTPTEAWVLVGSSASASSTVPFIASDSDLSTGSNNITATNIAFFVDSNSSIMNSTARKGRKEVPRYYNRTLLVKGDSSYINSNLEVSASNYAVQNSTIAFNFSQNLPDDEIRIAVGLVPNDNSPAVATPDAIRLVVDLVNNIPSIGDTNSPKARAKMGYNPSTEKYHVFKKKISEFEQEDGFSWANVNLVRIYASAVTERTNSITHITLNSGSATVTLSGTNGLSTGMTFDVENIGSPYTYFNGSSFIVTSVSGNIISFTHTNTTQTANADIGSGNVVYEGGSLNHKVMIDGMRLENLSTENPLYALVGYDVLREDNGYPVLKSENSTNYIEYRFGIGVDLG